MKTILRSIRFGNDLYDYLKDLAKQENRSFNNMVETILRDHRENNPLKQ